MSARIRVRASVAAGTSVIVGAASSLIGLSPAQAVTTGPVGVPACDNLFDSVLDGGTWQDVFDFTNEYVFPCVPQYGLGKVEFTISSASDLPVGFAPEDALATQVSSDVSADALLDYYGNSFADQEFFPGILQTLERTDDLSDPRSATYLGTVVLPLESVLPVDVTELPAECSGTYTHAYEVQAASGSTTLSGQTGNTVWTIPITVTPAPVVVALNVDVSDPSAPTSNGNFCLAVGDDVFSITDPDLADPELQVLLALFLVILGVFSGLEELGLDTTAGDFTTTTTQITLQQSPALANTGLDVLQIAGIASGSLILVLLGGYLIVLRRRRASRHAE